MLAVLLMMSSSFAAATKNISLVLELRLKKKMLELEILNHMWLQCFPFSGSKNFKLKKKKAGWHRGPFFSNS